MGMSAAHCQGNVREFQSVWRVVTLIVYLLSELHQSLYVYLGVTWAELCSGLYAFVS